MVCGRATRPDPDLFPEALTGREVRPLPGKRTDREKWNLEPEQNPTVGVRVDFKLDPKQAHNQSAEAQFAPIEFEA